MDKHTEIPKPQIKRLEECFLQKIEEQGVIHIPQFFSYNDVCSIKSYIKNNCYLFPVHEHKEDGFRSWRGLTLNSHWLARFCSQFPFILIARQILGNNVKFISSQYIQRYGISKHIHHRTPKNTGWHRDIYSMSQTLNWSEPRCAIKFLIQLSKATTRNSGPTRFLPGSHLHKSSPLIPENAIDPIGWVDYLLNPGDVIIFENRVMHAGGLRRYKGAHEMLLLQFGYRWLSKVPDIKHSQCLMSQLNPLEIAILEYPDTDLNGVYQPGASEKLIEESVKYACA